MNAMSQSRCSEMSPYSGGISIVSIKHFPKLGMFGMAGRSNSSSVSKSNRFFFAKDLSTFVNFVLVSSNKIVISLDSGENITEFSLFSVSQSSPRIERNSCVVNGVFEKSRQSPFQGTNKLVTCRCFLGMNTFSTSATWTITSVLRMFNCHTGQNAWRSMNVTEKSMAYFQVSQTFSRTQLRRKTASEEAVAFYWKNQFSPSRSAADEMPNRVQVGNVSEGAKFYAEIQIRGKPRERGKLSDVVLVQNKPL